MSDRNRFRRRVLVLFFAVTATAGAWLFDAFYGGNRFEVPGQKTFTIYRGQPFSSIVDSLEGQGIIRSRFRFELVARLTGGTTLLQVGKYALPDGISNRELFLTLREGAGVLLIPVTIGEGLRSRTQARILARTVGVDSAVFARLIHDREFIGALGLDVPSLEGYLMPDTYGFYWQTDEKEIIAKMVGEFRSFYTDSLQARARALGWTTNQVLTMASIVEGEAVLAEERARISGVYHNRLRKGMALQADPTIQFFIDGGPRRVRYSDLRRDHPYNTYRHRGLPPGPVNNPGRASVLAALWPESHQYLFFVANGSGGHWFTRTYAEHMRHVRNYRRLREARAQQNGGETTRPQ